MFHNNKTNSNNFRNLLNTSFRTDIPLKSEKDIELVVELFNISIQTASWDSTPIYAIEEPQLRFSRLVMKKVAEKRRLYTQAVATYQVSTY